MAASRHGGYRYNEFKGRDSEMEVSRVSDFFHGRLVDVGRDKISSWKGRFSGSTTVADREPGELSSGSGSGSDSSVAASSLSVMDHYAQKMENRSSLSLSKKRKFSQILWDDNQKEGDISLRNKSEHQAKPARLDLCDMVVESGKQNTGYVQCQGEDDFTPERNISFCRWAGVDEAEIPLENMNPKGKKSPSVAIANKRSLKQMPTLEIGEIGFKEDSGRSVSKSSVSEGEEGIDEDGVSEDSVGQFSAVDSPSENVGHRTSGPWQLSRRFVNMLQGCRSIDEFEKLNKINEGTYGVVYRAKDRKTGQIVALKKVKMEKEREGFPMTSLREINIMLSFHHPSIVDVKEVVIGSSLDNIFMVMEYMDHDLKGLMDCMKQPFSQSEVKCLMLQLLEGVQYLHENWVLHRDLKTSNLLLSNNGELKICDFGLARQYGSPLKPYTQLVVTLPYRAPELLLGAKEYSTAVDMWSLGCIMAELLSKEPLFCGRTELDQLDKIFRILGTPNEKIWPGFSKLPGVKVNFVKPSCNRLREKFPAIAFSGRPSLSEAGFNLLNSLLTYDPEKRITAIDALNHPWFSEVPLPKSKDFMPTFPAQHVRDRRLTGIMKSPNPL